MNEPEKSRASGLILVSANKKVLLFRHQPKSRDTFWAPPGGGLEEGETIEQAAVREASEELALDRVTLTLMWEQMTLIPPGGLERSDRTMMVFEGSSRPRDRARCIRSRSNVIIKMTAERFGAKRHDKITSLPLLDQTLI